MDNHMPTWGYIKSQRGHGAELVVRSAATPAEWELRVDWGRPQPTLSR